MPASKLPRKSSIQNPIRVYAREAIAARRVGRDAKCVCGEARPFALIAGSEPPICARCDRLKKGKSEFDWHHIGGKANSPIMFPVPVNDHRAWFSVEQYDWPKQTFENPTGDERLKLAAIIRGVILLLHWIIDKLSLLSKTILNHLSLH